MAMTEKPEFPIIPFSMPGNFEGVPPFMAMAFMPWMVAGAMMSQGIAFWSSIMQANFGATWPVGDALDQSSNAPAEELIEEDFKPAKAFKGKGKA